MILYNLKIALRNIVRQRTFSIINILGLGLGMMTAIFTFLWVQNELSFDSYHAKADHIYRVNTDLDVGNDEIWRWATTPQPLVEVLENEVPEVINTATLNANTWLSLVLKKDANILSIKDYGFVSENWFKVFDHKFLSGSPVGFQEKINSVILERDMAERLFGKWDATGETFQLDTLEFVVHAVIENHPLNSGFTHEVILPESYFLSGPGKGEDENWNNFNAVTFVELHPGTDLPVLGNKLTSLFKKYRDDSEVTLSVQPLAEMHFDEERSFSSITTGNRQSVFTFAIIGLIVLFLACVNYVSLTTAIAGMRTKEVGVRKIIGAGQFQIFRFLFGESFLTILFALVLALCAVQVTMPFFNSFTEKTFALSFANPAVWLVTIGTMLVALTLSGVYPALFLRGFSPGSFLQGKNVLKMKNADFRKGLVVVQFAVTVSLVIGALVIYLQQDFIQKKDLGYDRSHVFEFQVPYNEQRQNQVASMKQQLAASPNVVGTAASNMSIINNSSTHSGSLDWDGRPEDFVPTVSQASVDVDFMEIMKLSMKEGRWFLPDNEADLNNVLLNETAVNLFQLPEPVVGQKFHFQGREGQVAGIVKDFHFQNLRNKIGPLVIYNTPRSNGNILVKTTPSQAAEALAVAENAWKTHFPDKPFEYRFMDDTFDRLYKSEQKNAGLFKLLAGLAIFISCLGLFGLAVFSTEQRTKEIGIRKVLGATAVGIVGLLSKDLMKLVALSLVIACPLAYFFMGKWLQGFAYRIDIEWWVFAAAGALAISLAFLTVSFQSVKAALANPMKSLRSE